MSETLETGCPYDLDVVLAEREEYLNDTELRQRCKCVSTVYNGIIIFVCQISLLILFLLEIFVFRIKEYEIFFL